MKVDFTEGKVYLLRVIMAYYNWGRGNEMDKEIHARLRKSSKRLKKEYCAQKVILFGSYATGKATKDSDVDLFIIASTKERRRRHKDTGGIAGLDRS